MLRLIGEPSRESNSPSDKPAGVRQRDPLHALVNKCIRGDRVSERTLLTAVGPSVLAIVRRVMGAQSPEIDDVCQEAAIGLLSALPSFRAECTVTHFACRVTLLTSLAARRRGKNVDRGGDKVVESDELLDDAPSPAELIDSGRRRSVLRDLLDELPLAQAEVLALHVALGHTNSREAALQQFNGYLERSGPLEEEALVGRAQALQGLGRTREERGTWQRLLARFPGSVYAAAARERLAALSRAAAE